MEIKGKVHCFFEQSGTFKNEFIKLGIPAEDYDIQNNFGETDHVTDLFKAIDDAYEGKPSLFDSISKDDLIVAFFPCIYFCATSQMNMSVTSTNYRSLSKADAMDEVIKRSKNREIFYTLFCKMFGVVYRKGFRMVVENPYSEQTYLKANFTPPTFVDPDRTKRGDKFKKPTAYWFLNCMPSKGCSLQPSKVRANIMGTKGAKQAGLCSEERSLISPDYARNFICDFILAKSQPNICKTLFD